LPLSGCVSPGEWLALIQNRNNLPWASQSSRNLQGSIGSSMSLINDLLGALFISSYFVLGSLIYYYVIKSDEE
jgi:hypothetical protein